MPVVGKYGGNEPLRVLGVREIAGVDERRAAATFDRTFDLGEFVDGAGDQQDVSACIAEPIGQRLSNSARRTGDRHGTTRDALAQCAIVGVTHRGSLAERR